MYHGANVVVAACCYAIVALIITGLPRERQSFRVHTVVAELLGQRVLVTSDGEEGLALAGAHRPDLVLPDLMMPRMNGYEVVRHLCDDPATANPRVFAFTALARDADRVDALLAGRDGCIDKPFDTDALLERPRAALGVVEPVRG